MPHFIAEYTDNIEQQADLPGLFEKIHRVLGDSGVFPLAGIRSRGVRLDTWRMADGKHDYAFVHMTLKVGHGRDQATRQAVAQALFAVITDHFAELQAQRLLALSFEVIELHPQLNFKQNNVHAFLNHPAG
ncbi:5-carboxymethyl-2-hydroxymuconate Delta-isomerase [Pseudomonas sp. R5-89-07]|uniref:5-carboxymethyl-2-hydroxymuconate Delta-isomerase n=1 Tax=Pseudomonas sp. R5-89-07 TaxID=658644 RepID=UPI000F5800B6|nr:5-carboxymethyl-2-hydroxymuconate Delta-isomerase [Pseudomonas sp. R5-89-07]AZF06238.1 5-carboxymethyl-2-hydroxymuconate delta-isomerase [Pseudomonas sp. R5-89-07]